MLKFTDAPPESVLYLTVAISAVAVVVRLFFARSLAGLRPADFAVKVLAPVLAVAAVGLAAGLAVHCAMDEGWLRLIAVVASTVASQGLSIYAFGLTRPERSTIVSKIKKICKR